MNSRVQSPPVCRHAHPPEAPEPRAHGVLLRLPQAGRVIINSNSSPSPSRERVGSWGLLFRLVLSGDQPHPGAQSRLSSLEQRNVTQDIPGLQGPCARNGRGQGHRDQSRGLPLSPLGWPHTSFARWDSQDTASNARSWPAPGGRRGRLTLREGNQPQQGTQRGPGSPPCVPSVLLL